MKYSALWLATVLATASPAFAQDAGIKFEDMPVGTTLVTQSLSGKQRVKAQKYIGQQDGFHVMEESRVESDGASRPLGKVFYDAEGREVKSERKPGTSFYKPFSCHYAVGECTHTYDYPNPLTKKKIKRTVSKASYSNRLEGDTFYLTWKLADGRIAEVPYKLGPYNLRVSSEYENALGQLRGHKLVEIIEPSALKKAPAAPQNSEPETKASAEANGCEAIYARLKAEAPGDTSICMLQIKEPVYKACKKPSKHVAGDRPAAHVVMVLDSSGSMAAKLGGKTKMETAKREAARFLTDLEKDVPVGLVVYGHRGDNTEAGKAESCAAVEWAQKVSPIPGRVGKSIEALKPVGWTPLAATLDYLKDELPKLRKKPGDKESVPVVYVISDGKETCGGDPVASAKALHESGVKAAVNVIGFDVDAETRAQLEAISEAGGGKYFPAEDSKALRQQLNAAKEREAELARYNYCALLNIGAANAVFHNAQIELVGCHNREAKQKRLNLINKWVKEFDTPEEKACAAEVKRMAYRDSIEIDGKRLTQMSNQIRDERKEITEAAQQKWSMQSLDEAN